MNKHERGFHPEEPISEPERPEVKEDKKEEIDRLIQETIDLRNKVEFLGVDIEEVIPKELRKEIGALQKDQENLPPGQRELLLNKIEESNIYLRREVDRQVAGINDEIKKEADAKMEKGKSVIDLWDKRIDWVGNWGKGERPPKYDGKSQKRYEDFSKRGFQISVALGWEHDKIKKSFEAAQIGILTKKQLEEVVRWNEKLSREMDEFESAQTQEVDKERFGF